MFTTSSNPYTVKDSNRNPIFFRGCSTHKGEVENNRLFQAEIYICPISDVLTKKIALSEYSFNKIEQYSKNMFECLKLSLEEYLKNPNYGINSVHFFDKTENIPNQEEVIKSLYDLSISLLEGQQSCFPKRGLTNCEYRQYKKHNNSDTNRSHNKTIFRTRFSH